MKRPDLVVGGALVMSLPMLPGLLHGTLPVTDALLRFLIALFVAFVAGRILSTVFVRYSNEARRAEIMRKLDQARQGTAGEGGPDDPSGATSDIFGSDGVNQR